jgi:predicted RNA binding protein YcfA (HicA-like mRNA interferase family)
MTFKEADKMVRADGWRLVSTEGSHYHYEHRIKPGKVTIPCHSGDLPKRVVRSIKKQAGLL